MENIKNFIEESEKELKEEWNSFVKDTREYGEFPEVLVQHIEDFWYEKSSSRQISLIKMIMEMVESEKSKDCYGKNMENIYNDALDTISSKLSSLVNGEK